MAANLLYLLRGEKADRELARSVEVGLSLRADNELNPSTFAARVTAATGADIHGVHRPALAALAGPLHGGHALGVYRLLEEIGSADRIPAVVDGRLATGSNPGFGHPVDRGEDPRTAPMRRAAEAAAGAVADRSWIDLALAVDARVRSATGKYPNADFYLAPLYRAAGIPPELFAAVFAVARIPGWLAHVLEQQTQQGLIRPRAAYVGPRRQEYVPLFAAGNPLPGRPQPCPSRPPSRPRHRPHSRPHCSVSPWLRARASPAPWASSTAPPAGRSAGSIAAGDFSGKQDETAVLYPPGPRGRVAPGRARQGRRRARHPTYAAPPPSRPSAPGASACRAAAFYLAAEGPRRVTPRDAGQPIGRGSRPGRLDLQRHEAAAGGSEAARSSGSTCSPRRDRGGEAGHRVGAAIGAGQTSRPRASGAARQRLHAYLSWRRPRSSSPHGYGFAVTVLDKAAIVREGMGALHGGRAGERRGAALHRARVQGRRGRAGGAGRQGRHLRHRRHLDQAGAEHGGHEVRHVRCRRRARHLRDAGPAQAQGARRRADSVHREHALGHGGQAGRRGHQPLRARPSRSSTPTPRAG